MSKKQSARAEILADLKAAETYLDKASAATELAAVGDPGYTAHGMIEVAKQNILHAVERLIDGDWLKLWALTSDLREPEERP